MLLRLKIVSCAYVVCLAFQSSAASVNERLRSSEFQGTGMLTILPCLLAAAMLEIGRAEARLYLLVRKTE